MGSEGRGVIAGASGRSSAEGRGAGTAIGGVGRRLPPRLGAPTGRMGIASTGPGSIPGGGERASLIAGVVDTAPGNGRGVPRSEVPLPPAPPTPPPGRRRRKTRLDGRSRWSPRRRRRRSPASQGVAGRPRLEGAQGLDQGPQPLDLDDVPLPLDPLTHGQHLRAHDRRGIQGALQGLAFERKPALPGLAEEGLGGVGQGRDGLQVQEAGDALDRVEDAKQRVDDLPAEALPLQSQEEVIGEAEAVLALGDELPEQLDQVLVVGQGHHRAHGRRPPFPSWEPSRDEDDPRASEAVDPMGPPPRPLQQPLRQPSDLDAKRGISLDFQESVPPA